jgi:hypothetical protein
VHTKEGKVTASVEELAHYNMLLTEAIYELLADKGILSKEEVLERIQSQRGNHCASSAGPVTQSHR